MGPGVSWFDPSLSHRGGRVWGPVFGSDHLRYVILLYPLCDVSYCCENRTLIRVRPRTLL